MNEEATFNALRRCTLSELNIKLREWRDKKFQSVHQLKSVDVEFYTDARRLVLENGWSLDEYRDKGRVYIDPVGHKGRLGKCG